MSRLPSTAAGSSRRTPRRRAGKSPTIFDVAAAAGVSKSTVSNVVRGADDVAAATRERVLDAIRRLNYKPNAIARQFVQQRTTMLGVLVGDLGNPYYAQMARVVEREAFRRGYTAMFCDIEGEEDIALAGVEALLEHRIAGVVFLAFIERTQQLDESLRQGNIPIVFLGLCEQWGDSVGPDDAGGGKLAVEHLLSLGHRRIAYVRTPLVEHSGDRARYAGYRSAMRHAGAPASSPFSWEPGSGMIRIGRRSVALREALRAPDAPSGLFVSNDLGAISMMEACEQAGVGVPADVSIVGFDDITIASLRRISLTTVAQPFDFQARTAVGLLVDRIEKPRIRSRHITAPVELRVRTSTAAPATVRSRRPR
jgi:LacI family transcriptional regulator